MKKIAIEFEAGVVDARALARAVESVVSASRVDSHTTYVEGFSMNPSDKWRVGDPRITISEG